MEDFGLISAVSVGAAVALAAPVLVWALAVSGLRQVAKRNARSERQRDIQPGKADV
jgi:hypothetical protein